MAYVQFTYVDAIDPTIVSPGPLPGGPVVPVGCVFEFALSSQFPTDKPLFYGTTNGRTDLPGILQVLDKNAYDAARAKEMRARNPIATDTQVNAERDRRLNSGMTYNAILFQSDSDSRERIDRSRISALAAVFGGAQSGDLRWHGLPVDFFRIAANDQRIPMDAQTMVDFGNMVAAREGLLIVAGNDIKKRIANGEEITNVADNALWPA